jgi:hypothetical protein
MYQNLRSSLRLSTFFCLRSAIFGLGTLSREDIDAPYFHISISVALVVPWQGQGAMVG